ncbi:MAG TPA: hypothetical protein VFC19_49225 [Candidatus Limnocylindrales bacterium]|nr:hypothetical protein [Candidatus Limnocylindrales bacterium]
MALSTLPSAGDILTAAKLSSLITELRPVIAVKTADETVNNSATHQTDNHLSVAYVAGASYVLDGWLPVEGPTAADIKLRLTFTASSVTRLDWGLSGLATTATTAEGDLKSVAQLGATTSPTSEIVMGTINANWSNILMHGTLIASAAGTLTLEWAQNAATVGNTIIKLGAWMGLRRYA